MDGFLWKWLSCFLKACALKAGEKKKKKKLQFYCEWSCTRHTHEVMNDDWCDQSGGERRRPRQETTLDEERKQPIVDCVGTCWWHETMCGWNTTGPFCHRSSVLVLSETASRGADPHYIIIRGRWFNPVACAVKRVKAALVNTFRWIHWSVCLCGLVQDKPYTTQNTPPQSPLLFSDNICAFFSGWVSS